MANGQFAGHGQFGSLTLEEGTYTLEFPAGPDGAGAPPGEFGPVAFSSTKMAVEAMGEPVDTWPPSAAE